MSKVIFDGQGEMPELNRITAKKNYASSSQSHKMGATAMFNDILHYLAKEKYPALLNEVCGLVAVRQHPVYAFQKIKKEGTDEYIRRFIGLFTVGADKGDKNYFGFTDDKVKDKAIRLEGTDHIKGVGFNYPYRVNGVRKIRYNHAEESLCIVTGSDKTKWTKIWEQSYCANKKTEAEIEAYLEEKYMPAYEIAYNNNPLLVGVDMTIDAINADIDAFGKLRRTKDDRQYSYCEFWIDGEYDIYYLDAETNKYEKNGINLLTDLDIDESELIGLTIDEKNDYFINKRVERFKAEWENYFCKEDAIYQLAFLFIICASDNFEKNMYPYLMDLLWRFFQDDLDSIFPTDNQGQDTKSYSAELHDFTDDSKSAYVFKGEDSAFWQLVELACPSEFKQMGHDILQAMYDLAPSGTTTTEKLMSFFDEYFFSKAQNYFPVSAYNNDTEYSYEEAWNNKEYVASVDIHPLAQALGSHESTERAWLEKRIIYLMSKFGFGGFSSYNDTALGVISVRTQDAQSFTLTPAIDMYPAVLGGQAQIASADHRIKAGEAVTLPAVGGGNTNVYIVGADWLSDIGDLKDLKIDPSSVVALSIASKRLRRLKVGDENAEEVTSYLASLAIQRCDSMESVDARNLQTLIGTVDLSQCPRLIEALFGGTNTTAVIIAAGSKIERLELPDSITTIDLRDTKFLEDFNIGTLANVRFLRLENVPTINAFGVLKEAYNTEGQQLKDIRLVGFTYDGDATDLDMIANLATGKDKDGNEHHYNGIDSNGVPDANSHPVLEGNLNIDGYVYKEAADIVRQYYPTIEFTPKGYFIRFQDPEVLRVLLANGVGSDGGITEEQAAAVTAIGTWFKENTTIEYFDEFEKFTGVTALASRAFYGASNLKSINLRNVISLANGANFKNATSLGIVVDMPNLTGVIPYGAFENTAIEGIENLGKITAIQGKTDVNAGGWGNHTAFRNCKNLKYAKLPSSLAAIQYGSFAGCTQLNTVVFDNKSSITSIEDGAFCDVPAEFEIGFPNLTGVLGKAAFQNSGVKKILNLGFIETIDGALDKIGPYGSYGSWGAFKNCTKLIEVVFPNNLKNINAHAFYNCTSLEIENLSLPNLETLGQNAFYGVKIKKIGNLGKITTLPGASISTQNFGDKSVLEEVVLPETVTALESYAFFGYTVLRIINLDSIFIMNGNYHFKNCTSLEGDIVLPTTRIGGESFLGTKITSIRCDNVVNIDFDAFENCKSLKIAHFGSNLTTIGAQIFLNCSALEAVIIEAETPPTVDSIIFKGASSCPIYVPDASVTAYREASGWVNYADRIYPMTAQRMENVEQGLYAKCVGAYTFEGKTNDDADRDVVKDKSMYGNDMTITCFDWGGGDTFNTNGYVDDCLSFRDNGGYGKIVLDEPLDEFTIIVNRYRYSAAGIGENTSIIGSNGGDQTAFSLEYHENKMFCNYSYDKYIQTNERPESITWMTKDSYNGEPITDERNKNIPHDGIIYLGRFRGNVSMYSRMKVHDLYIFKKNLTPSTIEKFIKEFIDPEYVLPTVE